MKLSEAIRIGAEKRPQCTRSLYTHVPVKLEHDELISVIGSCALGAALEAVGRIDPDTILRTHEKQHFDEDDLVLFDPCPIAGITLEDPDGSDYNDSIIGMIEHLNDAADWTRERIADWVEALGY